MDVFLGMQSNHMSWHSCNRWCLKIVSTELHIRTSKMNSIENY